MRWAIRGCWISLLSLASCASSGPTPSVTDVKYPDHAIILTVRPVPAGGVEYVVRTDGGATLAIVQPDTTGLRPGASVAVIRGERAALAAR
jgi:hypothetical protein